MHEWNLHTELFLEDLNNKLAYLFSNPPLCEKKEIKKKKKEISSASLSNNPAETHTATPLNVEV